MSSLEKFQAELILKLSEIDSICHDWGYKAVPTLLLRHEDGASSSILLGNDSLNDVVVCIAELGEVGRQSEQSPRDAVLSLLKQRPYATSKVMATVQGQVAEEAFYDAEGNIVGYYAYGHYDPAYPYQG